MTSLDKYTVIVPPLSAAHLGDRFLILICPGEYSMDFKVIEIVGEGLDPDPGVLFFTRRGALSTPDHVTQLDEAQVFMEGYLKWDGCMNVNIDTEDECMTHFCGRYDASKVGRMIDNIYTLGLTHIEFAIEEYLND